MPSGRTTGTAFTVMPAVNARMAAMVEGCMLKGLRKGLVRAERDGDESVGERKTGLEC